MNLPQCNDIQVEAKVNHVNCVNTLTSNLNPCKPFASKPHNFTSKTLKSNTHDQLNGKVVNQAGISLLPELGRSTQNITQQPIFSRTQVNENNTNFVPHYNHSSSSFSKLPTLQVEPPFFNGSSADYYSFIKAFDVLVDQPLADPTRKLFFLLHYTKDVAHSLIKGCQHMPPEQGYQEARYLLKSYFGQRHKIVEACMKPIVKGPVLNGSDFRGLIKFSAELTSCITTMEGMECLNRMDNMDVVTKIMQRLPPSWIPGWQYEVDQLMHVKSQDISVKDLCEFVRRKTREITNLSQFQTSSWSDNNQERNPNRKATTFSTQVENSNAFITPKCPMCNHKYYLNQCKEFRNMSYQERLEFVNRKKLCRACLKEGHFAKSCKRKGDVCKKQGCKQFHTTLLHPPEENKSDAITKPSESNEIKEAVTNDLINLSSKEQSLLPIVPVKIRVNGSREYVATQALLDTGSTHSL